MNVNLLNVLLCLCFAVAFSTKPNAQTPLPLNFTFENPPEFDPQYWEIEPNVTGNNGLVEIYNVTSPWNGWNGGAYCIAMGKSSDGAVTRNAADLKLNIQGWQNKDIEFSFDFGYYYDETQFYDGIFFSDNGGSSWKRVIALEPGRWCNTTMARFFAFDFNQLVEDNNLNYTSNFRIRFQHEGSGDFSTSGDEDGVFFDNIALKEAKNITPAIIPYQEGFTNFASNPHWGFRYPQLDATNIPVEGTTPYIFQSAVASNDSDGDGSSLFLGKASDCGGQNISAADLHLNLSGLSNRDILLQFDLYRYYDETNETDVLKFSDDGGQTFKDSLALQPERYSNTQYGRIQALDLDEIVRTFNMNFSSDFVIRFQQNGTGDYSTSGDEDGIWIDNLKVDFQPAIEYKAIPFCENFEDFSDFNSYRVNTATFEPDGSLGYGVNPHHYNEITQIGGNGTNCWHFGKWNDGAGLALNQLDIYLNLNTNDDVGLTFDLYKYYEETSDDDGIWLSVDGGQNFTKIIVLDYTVIPNTTWSSHTFDLTALAAANNLSLSHNSVLRFQQAGTGDYSTSGDEDGIMIDNLCLTGTSLTSTHSLAKERISFYPNPANHQITFSQAIQRIELFDMVGRTLLTAENTTQIDLNSLQNGNYLLLIYQDSQIVQREKISVVK